MSEFKFGECQTRWLEALDSGTYPQTTRELHNSSGYCCLGVANEVCHLNEEPGSLALEEKYAEVGLFNRIGSPDDSADLVPVLEFVRGLSSAEGGYERLGLAQLNDRWRLTFPQIAQVLRKFPEVYFRESR